MPSPRHIRLCACLALIGLTVGGCGGDETPTAVAVAAACELDDGARAQVAGYLRLPGTLRQSDRATVHLFSEPGGAGDRMSVELLLGDGPNQLERLPARFTLTSLRVRGQDGTAVATLNDRVTLVGKVRRTDVDCVLKDVAVTVEPR